MFTGGNGIATFDRSKLTEGDSVNIAFIGLLPVHFRISQTNNYNVTMVEGISYDWNRNFITNNGKGFGIKWDDHSVSVNLPKLNVYERKYEWVEFTKQ